MFLEIQRLVRARFMEIVKQRFGVESPEPALGFPPSPAMGDLSIPSCFDLAKKLRQPPRKIAQEIADHFLPLDGIERVSVAGAGYLNLYLDRAALAASVFRLRSAAQPGYSTGKQSAGEQYDQSEQGKILVEHTSINPNKAAHIGHLRNAVLGDTLARLLRFQGRRVEVENYIDNTGVQVADVVVGFAHLEKKSVEAVRRLAADGGPAGGPTDNPVQRFDYLCWDLYARVFKHYEDNPASLSLRSQTLKAIEEGEGEPAEMAAVIAAAISRLHLETMQRLNVRYDLLVEESEILRLKFWEYAFELMKQKQAIRFEHEGKNRGCWVMSLETDESTEGEGGDEEDAKVIVRSNGTVTYVGKDIAYHLWKFNLLGRDFQYQRFYRYPGGEEAWRTSLAQEPGAPVFGKGDAAYAVIDTRQSYLQDVVRRAFLSLGYAKQAENMHHFSYEVVGLSPRCAAELGLDLSEEDQRRNYVEVSGRKGLGIKADDLINTLEGEALKEVRAREMTQDPAEQASIARAISVAALRYFLIKYTRRTIIAFDLQEALAFEGETGPYLQYTVVRAENIFRKFRETRPEFHPGGLLDQVGGENLRRFLNGEDAISFWEIVVLAAQLEMAVEQAISTEEPAALAKYAFRLAQAFNNFYHHYHILHEEDASLQAFLLLLAHLASRTLAAALGILGIEVPDRM